MSDRNSFKKDPDGRIDIVEFLEKFWKAFRKSWIVFFLCILLGAGYFGYKAHREYVPMYTASITFTIHSEIDSQEMSGSLAGRVTAEQMAKTFPYVLTSSILRQKVAEDLGVSTVLESIWAESVEDANFFIISGTSRDPESAYRVLESVVANYPSIAEMIVGRTVMIRLDETGIPQAPDNAKNYRRAIQKGVMIGAVLGLAWIVVVMLGRKTIIKEKDMRNFFSVPCLGVIPKVSLKKREKKDKHYVNLTNSKLDPAVLEAFFLLRNKVEFEAEEKGAKVILVTSVLPSEGKSTVAVNLALALAQDYKNVTLVDCDLRNPTVRSVLKLPGKNGLSELLQYVLHPGEKVLFRKKLGNPKDGLSLRILPGGEPLADGSELLDTPEMEKIIEKFRQTNDYVILDTAPVGLVTDALLLAPNVDASIFVIRKDYAKVNHISEGMEQLVHNQVPVIGCVLNDI